MSKSYGNVLINLKSISGGDKATTQKEKLSVVFM